MDYTFFDFVKDYDMDCNVVALYDDMLDKLSVRLNILLGNQVGPIHIEPSSISASDCVSKLTTYTCSIVTISNQVLFHLPIPIGSRYGYSTTSFFTKGCFIIEGKEKIFISQERRYTPRVTVIQNKDEYSCDLNISSGKISIVLGKDGILRLDKINIYVILSNLLSTQDPKEIQDSILFWCQDNPTKLYPYCIATEVDGDLNDVTSIPRLSDYSSKGSIPLAIGAPLISMMSCRCLEVASGTIPVDDKDDLGNKRLYVGADVIKVVVDHYLNQFIDNTNKQSVKKKPNVRVELRKLFNIIQTIEDNFRSGRWELENGKTIEDMSQTLSTKSSLDSISHVRRIGLPIDKVMTNITMRHIHPTQYGYICPGETPEGKDVGVTKYMASTALITPSVDKHLVEITIDNILKNEHKGTDDAYIFIDGMIHDRCSNIDYVIQTFIKYRRLDKALTHVSITNPTHRELHLYIDGGRYTRPLINKDNYIEFIDASEQDYCLIAFDKYNLQNASPNYTHVEIHPCLMFGIAPLYMPFLNHNQSSRVVFQSSMSKQAMMLSQKAILGYSNESKVLVYAQDPLCITDTYKIINEANGINVLIAIMTYTGYNQEDAIIVNRSSLERGLFNNIRYDIIEIIEDRLYMKEKFILLSLDKQRYDDKGIIRVGQTVKHADILATKFNSRNEASCIERILNPHLEPKIVVAKEICDVDDNRTIVRIKLSSYRVPIIGDKLTSRHSQKGIIGLIMDSIDMPYLEQSGIAPDLLINPHAIPSRMTIGHIIEMYTGMMCSLSGDIVNATAFNPPPDGTSYDKVTMINGMSGNVIECDIYHGICYYNALRHQSSDKAYSRSTGTNQYVSKQPMEGRSKGGGLRFGEMEKDCLIAHGAINTLQEKLMIQSDITEILICDDCSNIPFLETKGGVNTIQCNLCQSTNVHTRKVPYSFKLLSQQLLMANMKLGLNMGTPH